MYLIREMNQTERPRERLLSFGAHALSNEELLAILLSTGTKDHSVLALAHEVLTRIENLSDMKRLTVQEFMHIKGIKAAKATTLIAAIELGRRLAKPTNEINPKITSPYDVFYMLSPDLNHLDQEHFIVLYLNVKSELIKEETIYIGTLNQMVIHPRDIFKKAMQYTASAMVFVHNHPSGNSEPSKADIQTTNQMMKAADIMGIDIVDHLILGKGEFYSIRQNKKTIL